MKATQIEESMRFVQGCNPARRHAFAECGAGTKGCGYCASTIRMTNTTWRGNNAQQGGAIYAIEGCRLTIADTTFEGNHAQVIPRCLPCPVKACRDLHLSFRCCVFGMVPRCSSRAPDGSGPRHASGFAGQQCGGGGPS